MPPTYVHVPLRITNEQHRRLSRTSGRLGRSRLDIIRDGLDLQLDTLEKELAERDARKQRARGTTPEIRVEPVLRRAPHALGAPGTAGAVAAASAAGNLGPEES